MIARFNDLLPRIAPARGRDDAHEMRLILIFAMQKARDTQYSREIFCIGIGAVTLDDPFLDRPMLSAALLICWPVIGCENVFVEFAG